MHRFFKPGVSTSFIISLIVTLVVGGFLALSNDHDAEEAQAWNDDAPAINQLWSAVDREAKDPSSIGTDGSLDVLAGDILKRAEILQQSTANDRVVVQVTLNRDVYQGLNFDIGNYIWDPNSVMTSAFLEDFARYQRDGLSSVLHQRQPVPVWYNLPWLLLGGIYLGLTTIGYGIALRWRYEQARSSDSYWDLYSWNRNPDRTEVKGRTARQVLCSPGALAFQLVAAPVPGVVLTSYTVVRGLGLGIRFPFKLGSAKYQKFKSERKHPYRTELKDLQKILAELDQVSSTESVSQLRTRVQDLIRDFSGAEESVDERIHRDRLRLEQEAKAERVASRLEKEFDKINSKRLEDQAKEQVFIGHEIS